MKQFVSYVNLSVCFFFIKLTKCTVSTFNHLVSNELDIALCAHVAVALLPFSFCSSSSCKVDCTYACSVLLIQHVYV